MAGWGIDALCACPAGEFASVSGRQAVYFAGLGRAAIGARRVYRQGNRHGEEPSSLSAYNYGNSRREA
jgi:hypothetical protein